MRFNDLCLEGQRSVFLSNLLRPDVSVARLGDKYYTFDGGRIVARAEEWSSLHSSESGPSGYSSFKGEVIPVFDLGRLAGAGDCRGGQLAILQTLGGNIAILTVGVLASYRGAADAIDVHSLVTNPSHCVTEATT